MQQHVLGTVEKVNDKSIEPQACQLIARHFRVQGRPRACLDFGDGDMQSHLVDHLARKEIIIFSRLADERLEYAPRDARFDGGGIS